MGAPNCYGAIQGNVFRVTALTSTGAPLTGANQGYVSGNGIKVDVKPTMEKGFEDTLKSANGNLCQTFVDCDRLKAVELSLDICSLEPDLLNLMVPGRTFTTTTGTGTGANKTMGYEFPRPDSGCSAGVCLEVWQLAWDSDSQAVSNLFAANTLTYVHWVFPRVAFQIADFTMEQKFTVFSVEGSCKTNAKITANGPYDDWPVGVANKGGVTGLGGFFYDSTIPTAACSLITVTSAAS